jgi:hypothetical protein
MREPRAIAQAKTKARLTRALAKAERAERRQLEKSVSWTAGERLRFVWYWFWLTITDVQGASVWIVALPPASDADDREQAAWGRSISPF